MSDSKPDIPKFASFRAKAAPNASPKETEAKPEPQKLLSVHRPESRHERHHRHHESYAKNESRRHSDRVSTPRKHRHPIVLNQHLQSKSDDGSTAQLTARDRRISSPGVEFSNFMVDCKGDVNNVIYGSIHRWSVPPFHRIGAGCVLGVPINIKIHRNQGEEKGLLLSDKATRQGSREKYAFSRFARDRPRLLKIRSDAADKGTLAHGADYVSLRTRGKKHQAVNDIDGEVSTLDYDNRDYRSIHGKAKAEETGDENFEYTEESDSSESGARREMRSDVALRDRNVELSRKVEKSPEDIASWLSLIDHQDSLLRGGDDQRRLTTAEVNSTAEIKISMYKKALQNAKTLIDRECLLLGMMDEGSKVWEFKVQLQRWEKISQEHIDSLVLWKSYLDFRQTSFLTFRYEDLSSQVFTKRITLLMNTITSAKETDVDQLYGQLLYVLLRLTNFMRESGFCERAVAIWQALLELNFCAPRKPLSKHDHMANFREFWDHETKRIGENGSLGWRHFVEHGDLDTPPDARIDETEANINSPNIFRDWCIAERVRCNDGRTPARTMDEVAEDDPYRVILFSDIEPFLFCLPDYNEHLKKALLNAFLIFCRLPPMESSRTEEIMGNIYQDSFLKGEGLEYDCNYNKETYLAMPAVNSEGRDITDLSSNTSIRFASFLSSPETFFAGTWFPSFQPWHSIYAGDNGPVAYHWARNTLKQLTDVCADEELIEYYLAFELCNEPETIKKVAKRLLKQHSSSLRLYNAYALIEWARGNKDVAKGVFSAALSVGSGDEAVNHNSKNTILLWKTLIWCCLDDGGIQAALAHLLAIIDGKASEVDFSTSTSSATIIRTKQYLSSKQDYFLHSGRPSQAILYTECLALLEYLLTESNSETQSTKQGNITSALSIYNAMTLDLTHRPSQQLLLQSAARLLLHHARMGPFRPSLLRSQLTNYLTLFPQNTIFLSLFSWNESRLRIEANTRMRNLFLSTILTSQHDCLTSRLFAIRYEICHGTVYSARAAFEHAVSSPACRGSAMLWKFYTLFCAESEKLRSSARDVWLRGLRACPWVKELFITGFEALGMDMAVEEGMRIWRVMGEKELRLHVDLEEKTEDMGLLERPK